MKSYQNEEWLRNKIETEGSTHKEVSEEFGVSSNTITYFAKKFNIVRPGNTKTKASMDNAKKLRDADWLRQEYITHNKSYEMIANEYGVGKTTVARWVKRHGLDEMKNIKASGKREGDLPAVETTCYRCGKEVVVKGCRFAESEKRFCSRLCSNKDTYENTNAPLRLLEDSKRWRETEAGMLYMREHGARTHANQNIKETGIERKIREMLTQEGIEFETQKKMYYWCVDFYLPEYDIVIEAQGDYWHAHPAKYPEPNDMQKKNIRRDKGKAAYLPKCGHVFLAFWERDINDFPEAVINEIKTAMHLKSATA